MGIWAMPFTLEQINGHAGNTMSDHLGIVFTEIGEDFIKGTMPVNPRTKQPAGLLHGGASVAFAETLGSMSSWMCIDRDQKQCVGIEINANHIRGVTGGSVTGMVSPLHLGKSTHVWEIKITDEKDRLVCVSRITVAILDKIK